MTRLRNAESFEGGSLECDVAVVGSGAGGAVAAAELAEAGLAVIVLEEGPHRPTASFSGDDLAMVRSLYRDGGATATAPRLKRPFEHSRKEADRRQLAKIDSAALVLGMVEVEDAMSNRILRRVGVDPQTLDRSLRAARD
jgi:choline dehydrogenase-like flavoprotein